ncbi:MAG: DNA replication/repair protein RecF [Pseudomonadota bacterium]
MAPALQPVSAVQAVADRLAVVTLALTSFRNYQDLRLSLEPKSCVLTGPNGAGKTNLLEAVSLLTPGRGIRRAALQDLGRHGDGGTFAVHATVLTGEGSLEVGTALEAGGERRIVHVDGFAKSGPAALGDVGNAVWLTPAMDRLFVEGTASRRRLLDRLVHAGDPAHARQLARYDQLLRERSRLLREGRGDDTWLAGIERQAAEAGIAIAAARLEVIAELNQRLLRRASPFPTARLAVLGAVETKLEETTALDVEDWLAERLGVGRADDATNGGTRQGPHRSDLAIVDVELQQNAAALSTGRQKALLVGLVLAEAQLVHDRTGRWPLLLLDEAGAHLDRRRRGELVGELRALPAQTWITATEPDGFEGLRGAAQFFRIDQAKVVADVG